MMVEDVIMDYLNSLVALITMIEMFIILRLSSQNRRLNAENELLVRTIEIQTELVEKIADRIKVNK